jgi:hypothetical protein
MDYTNSIKIIGLVLAIILVGTGSVIALGISTPYWKNHPLEMYPGQTTEVSFLLVNKAGNPTAEAFVTLEKDGGVAEITSGNEYRVPAEARDVSVVLKISVPEEASIGDSYDVEFAVRAAPEEDQGGNVQLGVGYGVKFPVNVVAQIDAEELPEVERTQSGNGVVIAIVVLIIILILIFWAMKRKS